MQSLVVHLESVEEAREPFERTVGQAWLAEQVFVSAPAFRPAGDAAFRALLTRLGGNSLLVEATVKLAVESDCRRCLTLVKSTPPVSFTLQFVRRAPEKKAAADEHGRRGRKGRDDSKFEGRPDDDGEGDLNASFDADDADQEPFDGDQVDLAPALREQLLLALPSIEPLCREACKGLCSTCGQDLNEKDCGHSQKAPDPRWAALKGLQLGTADEGSKTPKA